MNANPNTTSYRMHELTRDRAMLAANRVRLAHEASDSSPVSFSSFLNRPSLRIAVALIITVMLLAVAAQTDAQAMVDGGNEAYHPALVSFRVGIYYQDRGRHDEAIEQFSATIEAFPMIAEAWSARADSYLALGEFELAIADYDAAVALAPELVSALNMRGDAYRLTGVFELATADYLNAIEQMPEYAAPHAGLAATYEAQLLHLQAIAEYELYLTLAGEDADPVVLVRATELKRLVLTGAM